MAGFPEVGSLVVRQFSHGQSNPTYLVEVRIASACVIRFLFHSFCCQTWHEHALLLCWLQENLSGIPAQPFRCPAAWHTHIPIPSWQFHWILDCRVHGCRPSKTNLITLIKFRLLGLKLGCIRIVVLQAAGKRYVLRKKPPGKVLASAHAVEREFRVLDALGGTEVPVPVARALCTNPAVLGTPFYVMDHVEVLPSSHQHHAPACTNPQDILACSSSTTPIP